jgi:hypothetical protein
MGALLLTFIGFYFVLIVFIIITNWKIFEKAGQPGWASIIPIYSGIVKLEIIQKPTWWLFMLFIPLVNIYYLIVMTNELAKSFGKESSFTVGLIFLPFIFFPILAFGDAKYLYAQTSELNEIGIPQE